METETIYAIAVLAFGLALVAYAITAWENRDRGDRDDPPWV